MIKLFKSCDDGVHKFEGRFDYDPPVGRFTDFDPDDVKRVFGRYTYVRDICVRCGKTIERNK